MIDKTVFFIWIIWYLNTYGYVHVLFNLIVRLHNFSTDFFIFYNNVLYPDYWTYENLATTISRTRRYCRARSSNG